MKIQMKGRAIPRDEEGDPAFDVLEDADWLDPQDGVIPVMNVFTEPEIVELVNRALYQLEYQHEAHRVRGKRVREKERALRLKVKEMYHVSWMKATEEQIAKARKELER